MGRPTLGQQWGATLTWLTSASLHFDTLYRHTGAANGGAIRSVNPGAIGNKSREQERQNEKQERQNEKNNVLGIISYFGV